MEHQPQIAVLILGFNHREFLYDALASVVAQTYTNFRISYIDNASSDRSVDLVRATYPEITVRANTANTGYAGAYDSALREVFQEGFDAAVLLNPDVVVATDWLAELVRSAYQDDRIALAQSKVLLWDKELTSLINSFGNKIQYLGIGYCGHYKDSDGPEFATDRDISAASGAVLLVKGRYYPSIIALDRDFFAYYEDLDLSWQAHLMNLRVIVAARSVVWHKYDFRKRNLNNFKYYLSEKNRLTFLLKYFKLHTLLLILPSFLVMEMGIILDSFMKGYSREKFRAYGYFLRHLRRTLRKRQLFQAKRVRSDAELVQYLDPVINFKEVDSPLLRIANAFHSAYFRIIKNFI